jgi:hypothetical protein
MVVWVALGGFAGLLVLADLTDYLLARAGKRSVLRRRLTEDQLSRARQKLGATATEARHSPFKYPGGAPPGGVTGSDIPARRDPADAIGPRHRAR